MDYMMPLTYVTFSYLSKVNLGRKVCIGRGHLVKTLAVYMSQCTPTRLSPLLLSCPYLLIGLGNWVGGDEENANYWGTCAQFFFQCWT